MVHEDWNLCKSCQSAVSPTTNSAPHYHLHSTPWGCILYGSFKLATTFENTHTITNQQQITLYHRNQETWSYKSPYTQWQRWQWWQWLQLTVSAAATVEKPKGTTQLTQNSMIPRNCVDYTQIHTEQLIQPTTYGQTIPAVWVFCIPKVLLSDNTLNRSF